MSTPYTRIPQWFFGLVPELTDSEVRVMLVVYRHTLGWNRDYDNLSYRQLQEEAGINSRTTLSLTLKTLEFRGLITRQTTRITAQRVQVYPLVPILPSKVVQSVDTECSSTGPGVVQSVDTECSSTGPGVVQSVDSQKKPPKKVFKETTNKEKLSESQEESLALMVAGGVEATTAERLIRKAWERGRDISYIQRILGYVSSNPDVKNPAGMIVSLIERNNDRIRGSDRQEAAKPSLPVQKYHLYDNGGPELVQHSGPREDCPVCRAESEG